MLAKPSGLLALAGLAARGVGALRAARAVPGSRRRRRRRRASRSLRRVAGVAARRLADGAPPRGNDDFWLARGDAARWDALAGGGWLGDGARLLLVSASRTGSRVPRALRPRISLESPPRVALAWSVAGPLSPTASLGYPFDGSVLGIVGWLGDRRGAGRRLVRRRGRPGRRVATYVALLVWLAPVALLWAGSDPTRRACSRPPGRRSRCSPRLRSLRLARTAPRPPAAASSRPRRSRWSRSRTSSRSTARPLRAGATCSTSARRDGATARRWRTSRTGRSRTTSNLARENVATATASSRATAGLTYFFPGRVEVRLRANVRRARGRALLLVPLVGGEPRVRGARGSRPIRSAGSSARARRSSSSASRRGSTPRSSSESHRLAPPTPEDCRIVGTSGKLLDAVFGRDLSYAEASRAPGPRARGRLRRDEASSARAARRSASSSPGSRRTRPCRPTSRARRRASASRSSTRTRCATRRFRRTSRRSRLSG